MARIYAVLDRAFLTVLELSLFPIRRSTLMRL